MEEIQMEQIVVNDVSVICKVYNGQRVVTLEDIDNVHSRVDGTARKSFNDNKKHLIENEDYFLVARKDLRPIFGLNSNKPLRGNPNIKMPLFTESGYLLLVKSFTDDLAWKVQRKLVNSYFKLKDLTPSSNEVLLLQKDLSVVFVQVNNIENMMDEQTEVLKSVVDNMTISTRQQEKILKAARNRVNFLSGGAHSDNYKRMGRTYLSNLWNNFKEDLHCGSSYKDLNPKDFYKALDYIGTWRYQEV